MVVCKFFLQGNCRFGANCRNEHPSGQGGSGGGGGGGGFGNQNRYGALSNNNNSNSNNNRFTAAANDNSKAYTLNVPDIRLDLTRGQGRPNWVLSTYGAGRGTPASLFEGNEYSPEEVRVRFYEMASKGQEAQADQEAIQLWAKAEQDLDNAASHVDDIPKFMEEAEKKHPNRYDFLKTDGTKTRDDLVKAAEQANTSTSGFGAINAFGQSSNNANPFAKPAAAAFGQASAPSAFGGASFGKPAQPSGFGQPAFGQSGLVATAPAFGQTSSPFGQNNSSSTAFGQPAPANAFGKPAFGTSGFGQSAFGQPSQPSPGAFGQGAQSSNQIPFGQPPSAPAFGASGFGQAAKPNPFAAPTATSGFGQSAFGQPAASAPAFGQPAQPTPAFGQSSQPAPAFGQASQPTSGFGQTAFGKPAQPGGFGQSGFGQSAQPAQPAQPAQSIPFGQASNNGSGFGTNNTGNTPFGQQQNASPFGQPTQPNINEVSMNTDTAVSALAQTQPSITPFGTPKGTTATAPAVQTSSAGPIASAVPQPNTNSSQSPHPLTLRPPKPLHYTQTLPAIPPQTNMSKKLTSYRGQQVQYLKDGTVEVPCYNRPDGRGPEKIWFPEAGATTEVMALNREDKMADLQEDAAKYDDNVKAEYAYLLEEGSFKDGKMPMVAPMREWCVYDF